MNDDTTILAHWPFVRAHLALGRRPAVGRVLDFVAEQQAKTLEPTAISAAWLRKWGASAGEAGRARTVARELAAAGVLHRWKGAGPRPDVWALVPRLERWRLPWTTPARSVDLVIRSCDCRARFAEAARFAGQRPWKDARDIRDSWFGPGFALPPSAHQDVRDPWRAAFDNDRAASADRTPSDQDRLLVLARLSDGEGAPPTSSSVRSTSSSSPQEAEEATSEGGRLLAEAVLAATGQAVFGAPARELDQLAAVAGDRVGALAAALRRQSGIRHAAVLARLAPGLLAALDHDRRPAQPDRQIESRIRALRLAGEYAEADMLEAQLRGIDTAVG